MNIVYYINTIYWRFLTYDMKALSSVKFRAMILNILPHFSRSNDELYHIVHIFLECLDNVAKIEGTLIICENVYCVLI